MMELRGTRVLVTGASGFIGATLIRELIRRDARVHVLVRPQSDLWRLNEVLSRITLHRADLADGEGVTSAVRRADPEMVYHLARHGPGPEDCRQEVTVNLLGTVHLLEAVRSMPDVGVVIAGSSLECGSKPHPIRESDRLEPSTSFGVAKATASLYGRQFALETGMAVVVLRLFSVYGPWESSSRLVPTAVLSVLHRRPMALTRPGYRRDFVFVEDVAMAFLCASGRKDLMGETVNIGSGVQTSNEDLVGLAEELGGGSVEREAGTYPARITDTSHWVADIDKARTILGWTPGHTLREGLSETIEWFRRHSHRYPEYTVREGVGAHPV